MEIIKDIYMVLGSVYANIANVYCIDAPEGLLLFDTGDSDRDMSQIQANMEAWGLLKKPVTHVFLSHNHYNHIGNAYKFREKGARIIAGEEDTESIETGNIRLIIDYPAYPEAEYTPCKVDDKVKDGDVIHASGIDVTCIHTPGHSDGSMFYAVELYGKKILFVGDFLSIKPDCTGAKLGWEGGAGHSRRQYTRTIMKVRNIETDCILPGHFQLGLANTNAIMKDMLREAIETWREPMITE